LPHASTSAQLTQTGEFAPGQPSPEDELVHLRARVRELETASHRDPHADALLSMLSHELRSPLQSLLLNVDLCLRRTRGPDADAATVWLSDKLGRQRRMANRLKLLIDTFLDVGQIAEGGLRLDPEQVDLGELVMDVVNRTAEELAWARCPWQIEARPGVTGRWDRQQLDLVIANLLSNAFRHGAGAPVQIEVWGTRELAFLRIGDHGPGIPREDQERIFDKFTRLQAPSKVGGFGLGLWIVRHVLEASGGAITVESEPGNGAAFTVALPRDPGA
jgi:signal transduction histidine kinase